MEHWKPITDFIKEYDSIPSIQLAHAGRKASRDVPWRNGVRLDIDNWKISAPSSVAFNEGYIQPSSLSITEIDDLIYSWAKAAENALEAGFQVIELHFAHGYLVHSFLSPISNLREDDFGGSLENRARFGLEIVRAVRKIIPTGLPLFVRISAVDGLENGWEIDDSVILSKKLEEHGVDVVDCSAGGISGAPLFRVNNKGKPLKTNMDRGPGFQVPYAEKVKNEAGIKTMAVGVIVDPHQAEQILQENKADLIAVGRELMYNPFWALHAAQALKADPEFSMWPEQYKWGVNRRGKLADFKGLRDEVLDKEAVASHLSDIYNQK